MANTMNNRLERVVRLNESGDIQNIYREIPEFFNSCGRYEEALQSLFGSLGLEK